MKKTFAIISVLIILSINSFSQKDGDIITMSAVNDFSLTLRAGKAPNRLVYTPFHVEKEWNALAGDDLNFPFHMASAEGIFPGKSGTYMISLNTLTERDGECAYNVYVNDKAVGLCQKNPPTNEFCAPAMLLWSGVEIPAGARIRVESNSYSNLKRAEAGFFEYARGRWTGIVFTKEPEKSAKSPNSVNTAIFNQCINIGASEIKPESKYHVPDPGYYMIAGGSGLEDNKDSFGYLYKQVSGDFIMEAGVNILGLNGNKSASAGIMVRNSSAPDAVFIACIVQNDGLVKLKYRPVAGETTREVIFKVTRAEMIQIEKKGSSWIVSAAKFGETYEKNSVEIVGFTGSAMIGLFVYSGSENEKEAAGFSNLRFFEDPAARSTFTPR